MKQLLFYITFITFLCAFSDSSASLFYLSENRRRFVSKVGHLWYFMGASCKVVSVETLPVLPARDGPHCFAEEKVGVAATVAPSFLGN